MIKLKNIIVALVCLIGNLKFVSDDNKIKLIGTSEDAEYFGSFTFPSSEIHQFNELYSTKSMEYLPAENDNIRYVMNEGNVFNFSSFLQSEDNKNETIVT